MNRGTVAQALSLCLAGTSLLFFSTAANAAPAPEGSYQQTCRNITASHGTLTAECQTRAGGWNATTLDQYRGCSGDISNNNGALTCARGDNDDQSGASGPGDQGDRQSRSHRDNDDNDADDNNDDNDRAAGGAPRGSYKDSCRNAHLEGDDLVAECRTRDGDWHRTTLDNYRRCNGDISNDDGRLNCDRDDNDHGDRGDRGDDDHGGYGGGWKPNGSYQETCRHIRIDHGDLEADCRTRSGDWRHSSLDNFRECRGDIANDNGRLVCTRGGRFGRITLYQHARFGGQRRTYDDDQPWLGGFADIASSAYVQGGRWQLCTRRNYRGRCVTIDSNIGNFNALGINDRVESLRRVR